MFKDLIQGSPIYIIHLGGTFECNIGTVISVINTPLPNNVPQYPFTGNTVDIAVKVGERTETFTRITPDKSTFEGGFGTPDHVFLATTKDAANTRLNFIINSSQEVINSVQKHESIIADCKSFLNEVNPVSEREIQQEQKIQALEKQMEEMKQLLLAKAVDTNVDKDKKVSNTKIKQDA